MQESGTWVEMDEHGWLHGESSEKLVGGLEHSRVAQASQGFGWAGQTWAGITTLLPWRVHIPWIGVRLIRVQTLHWYANPWFLISTTTGISWRLFLLNSVLCWLAF